MKNLSPTRKEIEVMLNRSEHVVRRWLREAGITHRTALTPLDVELLKKKIGDFDQSPQKISP